MLTPKTDIERLKAILFGIERKQAILSLPPTLPRPTRALSMSDALFSKAEELSVDECLGRILASVSVSCPPAVPVAVCGEIIDKTTIEMFKYYGINKCRVVKN
jgi:arginine/lysine/ornithine decarboxylase